jgi:hypothetical protein
MYITAEITNTENLVFLKERYEIHIKKKLQWNESKGALFV